MLTDDTRQAFARDGAVVVRGAFADWIDTLRDGVAQNEREPGPYFRNYSPGREQGRFFGDYANWQRIAPFRRFVEQGPAAAVARTLGARAARGSSTSTCSSRKPARSASRRGTTTNPITA
ncbi:hypothetical protein [Burkholderia gladioli]|uniref:hypothetical protein n=1 Tax=Burkholderia gladioli TaxID=28095 RepID=UPI003132BB18